MKNISYSFALTLMSIILMVACNKEEKTPSSQQEMFECHQKMTWDFINTTEALIGEWEWEFIGCFWNPEDANNNDFKGMIVEFKSNSTLEVKVNGQITQKSKWKVVPGDLELFAIDVDPPVIQLYGRILFCNNRIEFNDSYIDGCDNYFKKIK